MNVGDLWLLNVCIIHLTSGFDKRINSLKRRFSDVGQANLHIPSQPSQQFFLFTFVLCVLHFREYIQAYIRSNARRLTNFLQPEHDPAPTMSSESEHKEAFSGDAKKKRLSEHDIEALVARAADSGNIDMHENAENGEQAKWQIDLPEEKPGKSGKVKDKVKNLFK